MATGGDILEITYNHTTLGVGTLYPKSNEDSTFDQGGFRSNDDANMIDGAGNMIDQINRVRWSLECSLSWDMNEREDLDRLVSLAGSPITADWTITHANGSVWKGKGKPVGDLQGNGNTANFSLKLSGGGKLSKIIG
tara:strand:+ start:2059 stop:2469 length:411 start_codon:yes stop_codon:yes gene_type:complete